MALLAWVQTLFNASSPDGGGAPVAAVGNTPPTCAVAYTFWPVNKLWFSKYKLSSVGSIVGDPSAAFEDVLLSVNSFLPTVLLR